MNTNVIPNPNGLVLAAIDASLYGSSVADLAAWAALRLSVPLSFVHVLDRLAEAAPLSDMSGSLVLGAQESLLMQLTEVDAQRSKLARERGRVLLDAAVARAQGSGAQLRDTRLRHGHLVDTLVEMEPEVCLFVIGKRGERADFARGHLGGNLERVVRAVKHPLLVASRSFKPIERAMLAFDASPTVLKGVAMLAASPLFQGLNIRLQMAGTPSADALAKLEQAKATLQATGLAVDTGVEPGDPETVLAEVARREGIDLLVMGAYGHSRIRQLIVGSTTTALLRACQIPVLLLR